jgi:anti-anti-sigma regulatory factor
MLKVNMDSVGEAAIVECEGTISGSDEALQLYDAVTERAVDRVIVIDLSRVSVTEGKGLSMLLFLQRWARHRGIQLGLFNPCPSVRLELEQAISPDELEFVSLGEVMAVLIDAANRQTLAA